MSSSEGLLRKVAQIDPQAYGRTRNYLDGAVSKLGPWITHGAITLRAVASAILSKHGVERSLPFLFQLTWREHFYRLWLRHGEDIFSDLHRPQPSRERLGVPISILNGSTGISAIDATLAQLYLTGDMHNHARLWVASVCANIARCSWQGGARWMYYHLLDGDLASNFLSWQWVAGSASQKRYLANQENINTFSRSEQHGTFLDCSYEELSTLNIPEILSETASPALTPWIPPSERQTDQLERAKERILLYLPWTLDRVWRGQESGQRLLWFDTELFRRFPISQLRGEFISQLKRELPGDVHWFVGTEEQLCSFCSGREVFARAHPLLPEWISQRDSSEMLFQSVLHPGSSFMSFWKRCEAQLQQSGTAD